MTMRKAVFTVTCDDHGTGSDDIHLRPSIGTRGARILMVRLARGDGAAATWGGEMPTITISELIDVHDTATYDWNDSDEDFQLSKQLVYIDTQVVQSTANIEVDEWDPRHAIVSLEGDTPTYDVLVGERLITTDYVRCELYHPVIMSATSEANNNVTADNVYTVTMYYETAGDYRF